MIPNGTLSGRVVGGFPLSIATSLAFESIFSPRQAPYDLNRIIPDEINLSTYHECYINIATLFRNMMGASEKSAFANATPLDLKYALETEMEVINSLFSVEGNNVCKPIFYHCDYHSLESSLPKHISMRKDNTDGQKQYSRRLEETVKLLVKASDEIRSFDKEIMPPKKVNALLISHVPYDLLSFKNFNEFHLLESHTGLLKKKFSWNTKYFPVGELNMSILPFNRKLLMVFGDRVSICPSDIKLRRLVMDIAVKRQWNPMTTISKIDLDFQVEIMEPYVALFLKNL